MPTLKLNSDIRSTRLKPIGITIGDPAGIGPEITSKALKAILPHSDDHFIVIGDHLLFKKYNFPHNQRVNYLDAETIKTANFKIGRITRKNGEAALKYIDEAVKLIQFGQIKALVTAPVNKEAIGLSHKNFHGHTEYLAQNFKKKNVGMMFVAPHLRTIIVTRHLPIKNISKELTQQEIINTIELVSMSLRNNFKIKNPLIGVCGLNPHAGEGGTIGQEEIKVIIPALKKAKQKGIQVAGPFAADTLFSLDLKKHYDAVVAMYHDQGLIPIKTLYLNQLVNLTIGLPFIRTSPAHGTAFDIAGKNKANPASMIEAIKLAAKLS